jgi:hypothetical protein
MILRAAKRCSKYRVWEITHITLSGNTWSNIPPRRPRPRCECDAIEFRSFEMNGTDVASNFRKVRTTRLTTIYNICLLNQCDINIVLVRTVCNVVWGYQCMILHHCRTAVIYTNLSYTVKKLRENVKNSRIHLDRLQNKLTHCKGIRNNTGSR